MYRPGSGTPLLSLDEKLSIGNQSPRPLPKYLDLQEEHFNRTGLHWAVDPEEYERGGTRLRGHLGKTSWTRSSDPKVSDCITGMVSMWWFQLPEACSGSATGHPFLPGKNSGPFAMAAIHANCRWLAGPLFAALLLRLLHTYQPAMPCDSEWRRRGCHLPMATIVPARP
ncbi:uncharacterized protein LY79DRAFT_656832 [Colletotrichum navitas]|uniref:Uncharacterized protein n=1 Tax=Colletotrichum navitas TaxID=681940 RepID=A0AAD8Q959_9PEZI|nr:uncharacterized protein LY79DRAFT_656832 [Colletotrichum navitas]KAK1597223.1 hypothetical protein LY79DRAFT_656832 [Colletotrichum navitas]